MQKAKKIVLIVYLTVLHLVLLYFIGERVLTRYTHLQPLSTQSIRDPNPTEKIPTPLPVPEGFADITNANANTITPPLPSNLPELVIPVAGVKPEQLLDTFSDSRSDGRSHDAIDIAAPAGTPVIAAADGEIVKFWDSERGGITIYQLTEDKRFVLYYAHLQRRADEISIGMRVRKGATIGFVGDTGNAGAGNFHLHFSITEVTDPKRIFDGVNINPYPWLRSGRYPQPTSSP